MTRAAVREILRLMQRPTEAAVTFDVAREIATRQGAKAVLDGEIVKLGTSYVVSARLVSAINGAELAKFRETADGDDAIVGSLGKLSRDVRGKIGESLKNIHESWPLERVTTPSLVRSANTSKATSSSTLRRICGVGSPRCRRPSRSTPDSPWRGARSP